MKRMALLVLLVIVAAGCSPGGDAGPGALDREALLPGDYVSGIAGAPMKPVFDIRDAGTGIARWAWEETEGTPRLLVVEVCFPPEDCDALYNAAQAGAASAPLVTPAEAVACYDGRAAHIRFGAYYIRVAALGIREEKDALALVAARLAGRMTVKK